MTRTLAGNQMPLHTERLSLASTTPRPDARDNSTWTGAALTIIEMVRWRWEASPGVPVFTTTTAACCMGYTTDALEAYLADAE